MRVGILVLFLILEENFQLFTTEYDVSCDLVINDLYNVEIPTLMSFFFLYHERMLNFVKCFFLCLLRWSCDFWSYLLLMWCITLIDLCILNHLCIPGINSTRSWSMILYIYCWIQFLNIFLRIFASIFIKDIGL